jgi:hypothetical protein
VQPLLLEVKEDHAMVGVDFLSFALVMAMRKRKIFVLWSMRGQICSSRALKLLAGVHPRWPSFGHRSIRSMGNHSLSLSINGGSS